MSDTPTPSASSRVRVGFVDAARALAMLLMVQAHVCDTLLAQSEKATSFFLRYWMLRGLTGPLFFMLSGFALVVASDSSWEQYGRATPKLWKRLRRIGTLLLIGYFFQMPRWGWPLFGDFAAADWRYLLRSGVLHCISFALLLAYGLIAATRGDRRAFTAGAAALAAAALAFTPLMAQAQLPLPLEMLLKPNAGSYFPLFPWVSYILIGLVLGRLYLDAPWLRGHPRRLALCVLGAGAAMLAARLGWNPPDPANVPGAARWAHDLAMFFQRAGASWLLFGASTLAVGALRSPPWLKSLASNALAVYVLHLLVIYGVPYVPGLLHRLGPTLSLAETFAMGPLVLAACALASAAWDGGAPLRARGLERAVRLGKSVAGVRRSAVASGAE